MSTRRANAALPVAAALSCAVKESDRLEIERILHSLDTQQLYAVAVVLAAHVDIEQPMAVTRTYNDIYDKALRHACKHYGVDPADVLSTSRHRIDCQARMVAMAVTRRAGESTTAIGHYFHRDHTSVLYGVAKANRDPHLRVAVDMIVAQLSEGRGAAA